MIIPKTVEKRKLAGVWACAEVRREPKYVGIDEGRGGTPRAPWASALRTPAFAPRLHPCYNFMMALFALDARPWSGRGIGASPAPLNGVRSLFRHSPNKFGTPLLGPVACNLLLGGGVPAAEAG